MILSASIAAALISVRQIKNHTDAVRQSVLMIENTEILLEYRSLTIEEIFRSLSLSSNLALLNFIGEINRRLGMRIDYEMIYYEVINDYRFSRYYDKEDREYMSGFLSMLGKSDVSGQIANCKLYKEFFKTKLLSLETSEEARCKSIGTLILGAGIAAVIIII